MVVCGFLLGAAGQVVKLCADSAMQIDVDDALRGHVFTVQDSLFWMSFIVALTAAAAVIPADGHSPGLVRGGGGGLPGRVWRCTPPSAAAAPKPRAKVAGMAAADSIVDDLRAESDALDALVADLPAERWADGNPRAGLDHRPPDRPSAVDRPGRAVVAVTDEAGFAEVLGGRGRRTRADSSTRAPRSSPPTPPAELLADWRRDPSTGCTTSC